MGPLRFARTHGQNPPDIFNQKTGPFIKAEERMPDVIRELRLMQDIFPMPHIVARNVTAPPLLI